MPHGVAKKERNDTVWVNVEVDVQSKDWFLLAQAWPPPLSAEVIAVLTPWLGNLSCGVLFHSGPSQEIRNQLSLLPGLGVSGVSFSWSSHFPGCILSCASPLPYAPSLGQALVPLFVPTGFTVNWFHCLKNWEGQGIWLVVHSWG